MDTSKLVFSTWEVQEVKGHSDGGYLRQGKHIILDLHRIYFLS